jgi:hypothetical protein
MNSQDASSQQTNPPRSNFVTVLAWIFIVLSGYVTLISVLQNIIISLYFPIEEMRPMMDQAEKSQPMPWFAGIMFEHLQLFLMIFLIIAALTLASTIGLLKRKNWARIVFIEIMGFGILWNLCSMALSFLMFSSFVPLSDTAPPEFLHWFGPRSDLYF